MLLTIDLDLQRYAEECLKQAQAKFEHQSGAAVVIDVVTGDILAMASQPGFDPNVFARGINQAEWRDLLDNPERPLNNKAIQGAYPPGSTYKIVTRARGARFQGARSQHNPELQRLHRAR